MKIVMSLDVTKNEMTKLREGLFDIFLDLRKMNTVEEFI